MIIISILFSLIGAYFIYFGIDTIMYWDNVIWYVLLGAGYTIGGIFLIGYMTIETCDHYGWKL